MKINYRARKSEAILSDHIIYPENPFIRRDGAQYIGININRNNERIEMALCHEIAHLLLCRQDDGDEDGLPVLRAEIKAWRLAKSFCKPQYWSDSRAIENIESYIDEDENFVVRWRQWGSLKNRARIFGLRSNRIAPINRGISL
jgi:hypothetical protein